MDWGTIIPVLIGSGVALVTSISAEYMKYRQTTEAAARERDNAVRQQSREGLHTLVTQVQDSLSKMILVAVKCLTPLTSTRKPGSALNFGM
jgi:hypothetical protein